MTGAAAGVPPAHLYWTNNPTNQETINSANLDGSNPQTIITGQSSLLGVVGPQ